MTNATVPDDIAELDDAHDTMAADKYTAAFIFVTPELAERWLGKNDRNRTRNNALSEMYRRDMDAGNWPFTGEAIKFSADGRLLDGQHRLQAIVLHGRPILVLVVRGLDPSSQDVMDSGRKRTAADMFSIAGEKNAAVLAATVRLGVAWSRGVIKTSDTQFIPPMSHSEIADAYDEDDMFRWAVDLASDVRREFPANPTAIAFSAWLMARDDADAASAFIHSTAEMRTTGSGDPRFTLLKRLNTAKTQRERLTNIQQSFFIVRAWTYWRSGSTLKQLKAGGPSGPYAFPEPA